VIPDTALGVLFVVAAFGPGYVYVRVAETRIPRDERSGLLEAVELAVIGAFASTISLLVVAALADAFDLINIHLLARGSRVYFSHHPIRLLWLLGLALAFAYVLAFLVARVVYGRKPVSIRPGTAWTQAFGAARTGLEGTIARATIELRDGRKIEATVAGHATEVADNRDLLLTAPIRVQAPGVEPITLDDKFMLLREVDILAINVRFLEGLPVVRKRHWWSRAREPEKAREPETPPGPPGPSTPGPELSPDPRGL